MKGMFASLFDYEFNVNVLKALISCWNRPTHTIMIKAGKMCISLLDIIEMGGLLVWGEIYDEHTPQEVVEEDLLRFLILVYKGMLEISTHTTTRNMFSWSNGRSFLASGALPPVVRIRLTLRTLKTFLLAPHQRGWQLLDN